MSVVQHAQTSTTIAAAGNISVTLGATPTVGNTLVCIVNAALTGSFTAPAGWNVRIAETVFSGANRYVVYDLHVVAGTSATVTVGVSASCRYSLAVLEIPASTFDLGELGTAATTASYSAPGFTVSAADTVLGVVCTIPTATRTYSWTGSFVEVLNTQAPNTTNGAGIEVASKDVASGATGTQTVTISSSTPVIGFQLGYGSVAGAAHRTVSQEYAEALAASTTAHRNASQVYLEILGIAYPPPGGIAISAPTPGAGLSMGGAAGAAAISAPGNLGLGFALNPGAIDITAPTPGAGLSWAGHEGDIAISAPGNLGVGFELTPGAVAIDAPGALGLGVQPPKGDITITAPGNLTLTLDVAAGHARLEELYVEAAGQLGATAKTAELYVEAASLLAATARFDQVYVEVLYSPIAVAPRPLRLTQRDDGLGVIGHARIQAGSLANAATSTQLGQVPRIGTNNRYS